LLFHFAPLAALQKVHHRAVAVSVALQDVCKQAVYPCPISAISGINCEGDDHCVTNVTGLGDDDAFKLDLRTVGVGRYYVPVIG